MPRLLSTLIKLPLILSLCIHAFSVVGHADLPKETVELQSGSVKVRIPAGWHRKESDELRHSALYMRENPRGLLSIEAYSLEDKNTKECSGKEFQMKYLQKLQASLPEANMELKETSLFNTPVLIHSSYYGEDNFLAKDYHVVKNCKYYILGFRGDNAYDGEKWSEIDGILRSVEFV